jgi:predicted RNA-binding protein YlxR (DUF448 family)/ribosomal protein L7Ae-like RNA K-turn-binding protein
MRKCLATGDVQPVSEMIRFVLSPDGIVTPDVAAKLPGRGCWITADKKVILEAVKKNLFVRFGHKVLSIKAKALKKAQSMKEDIEELGAEDVSSPSEKQKRTVIVPKDLAQLVEDLLLSRALDYIGLANRSGLVISGYEKAKATLQSKRSTVALIASDAAAGSRKKLLTGEWAATMNNLRVIDMFSRDELSQKLGLGNAVHSALLPGGAVTNIITEVKRLESFRNM